MSCPIVWRGARARYGTRVSELIDLARRYAREPGMNATPFAPLEVAREDGPTGPQYHVGRGVLCLPLQGRKELTVGDTTFQYTPGQYFVASVSVPSVGRVTRASTREPYLCLVLTLDPADIYSVVRTIPPGAEPVRRTGVFVEKTRPELEDAFVRLLRALGNRNEQAVLGPLLIHEILFRLLTSSFGALVREVGIQGSQVQRIACAIEVLRTGFHRSLRVSDLAKVSRMSVPTFHEHFRRATLMTPLQFQKQLRLQEARRLLVAGEAAADAAHAVGYESPSQFNREYARLFGLPPKADARRWIESNRR